MHSLLTHLLCSDSLLPSCGTQQGLRAAGSNASEVGQPGAEVSARNSQRGALRAQRCAGFWRGPHALIGRPWEPAVFKLKPGHRLPYWSVLDSSHPSP